MEYAEQRRKHFENSQLYRHQVALAFRCYSSVLLCLRTGCWEEYLDLPRKDEVLIALQKLHGEERLNFYCSPNM